MEQITTNPTYLLTYEKTLLYSTTVLFLNTVFMRHKTPKDSDFMNRDRTFYTIKFTDNTCIKVKTLCIGMSFGLILSSIDPSHLLGVFLPEEILIEKSFVLI